MKVFEELPISSSEARGSNTRFMYATTTDADDEKGRSISELVDEFEKIGPDGWKRCNPGPEMMAPVH